MIFEAYVARWIFNVFITLKWCPEVESNYRHKDFQSFALPTELSGHKMKYINFYHVPKQNIALKKINLEDLRARKLEDIFSLIVTH